MTKIDSLSSVSPGPTWSDSQSSLWGNRAELKAGGFWRSLSLRVREATLH